MVPCTSPLFRLSLGVLLSVLLLSSFSWALPEIDVRSQVLGARQISAAPPDTANDPPLQPDQLLVTSYTCPTFGRIQILVTGRLTQSPKTHFESWWTQLSISRNSLTHTPSARFYDAPSSSNEIASEDVTLQHLSNCDAGQLVIFRLLGNKGRKDQANPVLQDSIMSLTFVAIGSAKE